VLAGKVPVAEILSSDVTTHWIETRDAEGEIDSFSVTSSESPSLSDLLKLKGIQYR
jgi:hypothetical protein